MWQKRVLTYLVSACLIASGALASATPAPPPGAIQRELDKKHLDYFTGRWVVTYTAMGMQHTVDVLYRPDGTFVGTDTVRQYTEMQYPLKGTWTLTGLDDTSFTLTIMVVGQGSSSDTLTVIDKDTLFSKGTQENVVRVP